MPEGKKPASGFFGYHGDYPAYRAYLESVAEEPYRVFSQKLTPGCGVMLGVRVPILRGVAKKLVREDWRAFLDSAREDTYEETLMQGLVLGLADMELAERLERVRGFVPKIANWAVCDYSCSSFHFAKQNQKAVCDFLQPYLAAQEEFALRFGIVMLMSYFISEEWIDDVLKTLSEIHSVYYYAQMAQAWALAECYVKFPEKTMPLLRDNTIDDWTYHKALQKMTESLRVGTEEKRILRAMKRT